MTPDELAACPKCGGTDLSVSETHAEIGTTVHGPVTVRDGLIYPTGPFHYEAGEILRVDLHCGTCGHEWKSRRPVGGVTGGES